MKKFRFIAVMFMAIMTCAVFSSCSDDDDDDGNISDIVGTWYATGSGGKRSLTLTFNNDKTGRLDMVWDNVTYTTAVYSFTYTYGGGKVKCSGTIVESSADGVDTRSADMEFKYSGGKLTGGNWGPDAPYTKR